MTLPIDQPDDGPDAADDRSVVAAAAARCWAAELLDVPSDGDLAAQRTTVLRKLADDDFMAWDQGHVAVTLLAGNDDADINAADRLSIVEGAGRTLQKDVQTFSQQFFDQSPSERRQRWEELRSLCASYPALVKHLDRLKSGLDVVPQDGETDDDTTSEVITAVCREFTAWPSQSARVRRVTIERFSEDAGRWSRAADAIARKRPDIAGLMPTFHEEVRQLQWRDRRMTKGRRKREKLQRAQPLAVSQPIRTSQNEGPNWAMFALLFPLFLVLRACAMTLGTSTPEPEPTKSKTYYQLQRALESSRLQSPTPDGRPLPFHFDRDRSSDPTNGRMPLPWEDVPTKPLDSTPESVWDVPTDYSIMPRTARPGQRPAGPLNPQPPTGLRPPRPGSSPSRTTPDGSRPQGRTPGGPSPPAVPGGFPR